MGYQLDSTGNRLPAYAQLLPYEGAGGLNGYVVESSEGYSVTFLGTYDGSDQLLEVNAGCDCSVDLEAVREVLNRITVFDQPSALAKTSHFSNCLQNGPAKSGRAVLPFPVPAVTFSTTLLPKHNGTAQRSNPV